jgi:hypothetical protein
MTVKCLSLTLLQLLAAESMQASLVCGKAGSALINFALVRLLLNYCRLGFLLGSSKSIHSTCSFFHDGVRSSIVIC